MWHGYVAPLLHYANLNMNIMLCVITQFTYLLTLPLVETLLSQVVVLLPLVRVKVLSR
jgi:hypothetical protein